MKKEYWINPGSKNGDMVIYINFNDGNVDTIPYEPFEDIDGRIEKHVNKYKLIKRHKKINRILKKL